MPRKKESLEEIAERYEAMIDDDSQDDNFVPIKATVKSPLDVVYSTRYSADEIELIWQAAEKRNMPPTTFIRAAALAAASGELNLATAEKAEALQDAKAKARALAEVLQRI